MTQHSIAHTPRGYQCYRLVNGLYTLKLGPLFPDVRDAIRYSDQLDALEPTTPLRTSAEAPDPRSLAPSGVGPVGASAESRKRDSGPIGLARE